MFEGEFQNGDEGSQKIYGLQNNLMKNSFKGVSNSPTLFV